MERYKGRERGSSRGSFRQSSLVACTTQIGTSVRAKRRWILGVSDEEMSLHSEELTTTKAMPIRGNPLGRWGLPAISSLRAVLDALTSTSVSRLDLAGKTHRRWSRFGWYRSLVARQPVTRSLVVCEQFFFSAEGRRMNDLPETFDFGAVLHMEHFVEQNVLDDV